MQDEDGAQAKSKALTEEGGRLAVRGDRTIRERELSHNRQKQATDAVRRTYTPHSFLELGETSRLERVHASKDHRLERLERLEWGHGRVGMVERIAEESCESSRVRICASRPKRD